MEHPRSLADEGRAEGLRVFARNALCALAAPGLGLDPANLVRRLLDPAVRVGTSTPKADPSGDYAFEMFERIESSGAAPAGSAAALKAKALQLTGGPNSAPPPADRNVYGVLVAEGSADVFITYCTNATIARQEQPRLQVVAVPESINVAASYGLAVLKPASPPALKFAEYLSGPAGQRRLAAFGFSPP
jgi:ABC-type molybdate transport system substrate-binding protein